ncbi:metalloregulator ArsR/SmtB family transcription factor [Zhihengliuella alba]|uniref:Metalloregulator ArsR/SmtB family transcription factor n=1 Tax=Zhihengliuella alba TaxID=547018 RepID=A0ABP7DX52_9MICC
MTMPVLAPVERTAVLDGAATAAYADLFHALSDPTRLAILQHLATGPHRVCDLVDHLGFAQSTVSKHLACLRGCGLAELRTEGRASWFSLAEPRLLADLLRGAQAMLAATGEQATLCEHLMHPGAAETTDGD